MGKNRSYAEEIDHRIGAMEVKLVEYRIARKVLAELSGSAAPEVEIEHQPVVNGNGAKMPLVTISRERQPEPPPKKSKKGMAMTPGDPARAAKDRTALAEALRDGPMGRRELIETVSNYRGYRSKAEKDRLGWQLAVARDNGQIAYSRDDKLYSLPG